MLSRIRGLEANLSARFSFADFQSLKVGLFQWSQYERGETLQCDFSLGLLERFSKRQLLPDTECAWLSRCKDVANLDCDRAMKILNNHSACTR